MAIGDKAAAKGLAVYTDAQDRRKGWENDNQRGDDIADVIDRVAKLEAGAAKFLALGRVNKQVNSVTIMDNYASPLQNQGFTSWSGSLLTIKTPGDYMVVHSAGSAGGLTGGQTFITINGDAAANRFAFQDGPKNMTSVYVGTFKAGDTIRPYVYADATGQVDLDRTSFSVRSI
jgi:hypothetical protein